MILVIKIVLLISSVLFFVSCSLNSSAQSNSDLNINSNKSTNAPSGNFFKPEIVPMNKPVILTGVIGFNKSRINNKIGFNFVNFENDKPSETGRTEDKIRENHFIVVDIMNCAGYVGSSIAIYRDGGWDLDFNQSSAAPDAIEKINKCSGRAAKDDDIASYGFAVAPFDEKRKSVKIEKQLDLRKAFASLPVEEQNRAVTEDGESLLENPQLIEKHIGIWWTDLDGDGAVDLMAIDGKCLPFAEEALGCEKIWLLSGGGWREAATRNYEGIREIKLYSKEPQILSGAVIVKNGKLSLGTDKGDDIWRNGDSRYGILPIAVPTGTVKEAAIVNCAGYLGIVKAVKIHDEPFREQDDLYSWKLKLIPQSIAADAAKKIEKCRKIQENELPTASSAFALFQFSPDIKKTKVNLKAIKQPNLRELYESLPDELKKWLQESEQAEEVEPRPKGTLDLKTDTWADIDGDGKVDLIDVYGGCSGKTSAYTCGRIFQLIGGEWKEISFNTPL